MSSDSVSATAVVTSANTTAIVLFGMFIIFMLFFASGFICYLYYANNLSTSGKKNDAFNYIPILPLLFPCQISNCYKVVEHNVDSSNCNLNSDKFKNDTNESNLQKQINHIIGKIENIEEFKINHIIRKIENLEQFQINHIIDKIENLEKSENNKLFQNNVPHKQFYDIFQQIKSLENSEHYNDNNKISDEIKKIIENICVLENSDHHKFHDDKITCEIENIELMISQGSNLLNFNSELSIDAIDYLYGKFPDLEKIEHKNRSGITTLWTYKIR